MKYKTKSYWVPVLCLALATSSCKKFLDVSPKTQIKESEQFSSRQGFIDALTGLYQKTISQNLYGGELTYSLLEILAQRYEGKASATDPMAVPARYNYMASPDNFSTLSKTQSIWSEMYAAIAQCNFILENVDKHRSVLTDQDYGIIKGEALGLRAFMHFDLLRLFAPAYKDGTNASAQSIPYMEAFQVKPQARLSLQEALGRCERDLLAADTLLSVYPAIDQIAGNQNVTTGDLSLLFRQNHFNYWAAKAALARLYLYMGNKPLALSFARQVIDGNKFRFIPNTALQLDPTGVAADLTFTPEHIFSIYVFDLKTRVDNYFKPANPAATADPGDLFSTRIKLNNAYEVQQPGYTTDIRGPFATNSLWYQMSTLVVYSKKFYSDNAANVRQSLVPLIRLPEMYYIAAESASTVTEGLGYLNTVRRARLLPVLNTPASADLFNMEIQKEYQKEFYGEGQLWHYYKRKNVLTIPDGVITTPMDDSKYVFPYPTTELEFGTN